MPQSRPRRWRTAVATVLGSALALTGLAAPAVAAENNFTLKGTVTVNGKPVETGLIELLTRVAGEWTVAQSGYPSTGGAYQFTSVPEGEYTLLYLPLSGRVDLPPAQALGGVDVSDGVPSGVKTFRGATGTMTLDVPLVPGVLVQGRVVAPAGTPSFAVWASYVVPDRYAGVVFGYRPVNIGRQEVGSDGRYAVRVFPGRPVLLQVFGADRAKVESLALTGTEREANGIFSAQVFTQDTTLPTKTLGTPRGATGRVVSTSGAPVAGVNVSLHHQGATSRVFVATTTTGADGRFTFPAGVFEGQRYTVSVQTGNTSVLLGGYLEGPAVVPALRAGSGTLTFPDLERIPQDAPRSVIGGVHLKGFPGVGSTLAATGAGNTTGITLAERGATARYQWTRSGYPIPGATGPSYTLRSEDLGHAVGVTVFSGAPGHRGDIDTSTYVPVQKGVAPAATTHPAISGSAKVGSTLTVSQGAWSVAGTRLAYQWLRDGKAVTGATAASYRVQPADQGKRLSVRITATATARESATSVTAPTAVVALGDAPKATKKPKITGTVRVGKKLKVSKGTWSLPGVKVSYQWLRGGKKIAKATKATYKLTAKDKGKKISVRVSAKKAGYKTGTVVTKATKKVKAKR